MFPGSTVIPAWRLIRRPSCAAWLLLASTAAARPGSIDLLPADTDVALHVRDAAELRQAPAGRAVRGILTDLGAFDRASAAWRSLATSLELEPGECFDALLGDDAVLGIRWRAGGSTASTEIAAPPEWVLVSRVSASTEAIVARRLRLAPRELVARRHVLALEDGSFEVAIVPLPAGFAEAPTSRLLLAPAHSSSMLIQALENFVGGSGEPTLADAPGGRALETEDRAVHVLVRTRQGMPGWLRWPGREGLIVGSMSFERQSATIEWTMSASLIEPRSAIRNELAQIEPIPDPNTDPNPAPGQRLAGGVVRPGAWASAIVDRPLEETPLRFAAWIEEVRWDVRLEDASAEAAAFGEGVAHGRAWVRFNVRDGTSVPRREP